MLLQQSINSSIQVKSMVELLKIKRYNVVDNKSF